MTVPVDDPFFAAVAYEEAVLPSTGRHLRLPLRYPDSSTFDARFTAPTAVVRAVLPSPMLVPREVAPGRVAVGVTVFDHRGSDVGTYGELGVFLPVAYHPPDGGGEVTGAYCALLPVTTEEACVAGIDVWGFPKFVAAIEIATGDAGCRCRVHEGGRELLTLEIGAVPVAPRAERMEYPVFTVQGNELLYTVVVEEGRRGHRSDGNGVRLALGDHPRVDTLRRLGLEAAVGQSRTAHAKAVLPGASRRFSLRPTSA
jgi:hypothetical protein